MPEIPVNQIPRETLADLEAEYGLSDDVNSVEEEVNYEYDYEFIPEDEDAPRIIDPALDLDAKIIQGENGYEFNNASFTEEEKEDKRVKKIAAHRILDIIESGLVEDSFQEIEEMIISFDLPRAILEVTKIQRLANATTASKIHDGDFELAEKTAIFLVSPKR